MEIIAIIMIASLFFACHSKVIFIYFILVTLFFMFLIQQPEYFCNYFPWNEANIVVKSHRHLTVPQCDYIKSEPSYHVLSHYNVQS